jgi:hypothetical protein
VRLEPIAHTLALACSAEHAFDMYAGRIGDWWPARYTASAETVRGVVIEAGQGGRVYERHADGTEIEWGRVTVWRPGQELAYSSTLAQTKEHPSEIRVAFSPTDEGCRLSFEHGGWVAGNASYRHKFGDWSLILDAYAALAQGRPTRS